MTAVEGGDSDSWGCYVLVGKEYDRMFIISYSFDSEPKTALDGVGTL